MSSWQDRRLISEVVSWLSLVAARSLLGAVSGRSFAVASVRLQGEMAFLSSCLLPERIFLRNWLSFSDHSCLWTALKALALGTVEVFCLLCSLLPKFGRHYLRVCSPSSMTLSRPAPSLRSFGHARRCFMAPDNPNRKLTWHLVIAVRMLRTFFNVFRNRLHLQSAVFTRCCSHSPWN